MPWFSDECKTGLALASTPSISSDEDDDSEGECPSPPKDLKQLARCLFFLQGISTLFPFNTYVTATAYFSLRLKGTPHESNFENTFSIATMLANTVGFVLALSLSRSQDFNMRASVAVPLIVITATLALSSALVQQDDMEPEMLFRISLASVAVCAVSAAFLQMGIFGFAARFPPHITHAVLVGQGSAGIVISLLSFLTTLREHSDNDVASAAFVYFLVATSVVFITLLGLGFMSRLEFAMYYAFGENWYNSPRSHCVTPRFSLSSPPVSPINTNLAAKLSDLHQSQLEVGATTEQILQVAGLAGSRKLSGTSSGVPSCYRDFLESPACSTAASESKRAETPRSSLLSYKRNILESPVCSGAPSPVFRKSTLAEPLLKPHDSSSLSVWRMLRCISGCIASVVMSLMVTLTVFPALLVQIHPASNPTGVAFPVAGRVFGDLWVPLLFLTFNVCDTLGRMLSRALAPWPRATQLFAVSRYGFIPLILCMSAPSAKMLTANWALLHDAGCVVIVALLALSSGMIHGAAMIHAPGCVPNELKSRAGTFMAFSLQTGLLLGSTSSWILHEWR